MSKGNNTSIDGDNNVTAHGDIIINNGIGFSASLKNEMDMIDERINERIGKIVAKTKGDRPEEFSSEQMMRSMINIGVPAGAVMEILEKIEPYIIKIYEETGSITTSDIRKAVSISIYNLSGNSYSNRELQGWGDAYVRRYGDATKRIMVIENDGLHKPLDFKYIKKIILCRLIKDILDVDMESITNVISSNAISFMSKSIMEHIKSLTLHTISYDTLLFLSRDLALQPPHPWFVTEKSAEVTADYDLERAEDHFEKMTYHWNNKNLHACWHSVEECIYHSCSLVLAYYRMFIGCSNIASLTNLLNILNLCSEKTTTNLWESARISQIKGDLKALEYSITGLSELLNHIINVRASNSDSRLKLLLKDAHELFYICSSVVGQQQEIDRLISAKSFSNIEFKKCSMLVLEMLLKVPNIRLSDDSSSIGFWVVHNINTAVFRDIKAKILIMPICVTEVDTPSMHDSMVDSVIEALEENIQHSNTAIFVVASNDVSVFREKVRRQCGVGLRTVVAPIRDVLEMCKSNSRTLAFENLILSN